MTESQTDLYNFLKRQAAKGLCPSFDEMRAYLGLASKSGVHRLLTALEEQGRIRRDKNRARRIEILPERTPLSRVSTGELIAELTGRGYCAIPRQLLESVGAA